VELLDLLPHRYPFLLVDKIVEADEKRFLVRKNVSFNEPHFQGHFPEKPVMPGVLIIEAMAQAAVASLKHHIKLGSGKLPYLAGVDETRFLRPVVPGDVLEIEGELLFFRRGLAKARVEARVDGELAAKGVVTFVVKDA